MGNCQAVDAAALVIQHPSGKIERLYWPVSASEVMRNNPGHYVSLIIPLPVPDQQNHQEKKTVLFTHVKLLRPNETLTLGHAYRLITTQEVVKVLRARKHAKMRKPQTKITEMMQTVQPEKPSSVRDTGGNSDTENTYQDVVIMCNSSPCSSFETKNTQTERTSIHRVNTMRAERQRLRAAPVNPPALRPKPWRPSLQSISEAGI